MNLEMHISKFLSRIDSGNLYSITQHLLQKPALIPTFIWTMNLSHIREVSAEPKAFEFLESNSLIVADGWPVKYLVRALESRKVSRVPGVDLVDLLLKSGIRYSVIGSDQGQVQKTIQRYLNASLELTFVYDKYIDINSKIQSEDYSVKLNKPITFFLALGFSKAEIFIRKNYETKSPVSLLIFLALVVVFSCYPGRSCELPECFKD